MTRLLHLYTFYLSHPEDLLLHFAITLASIWIVGAVIFAVWANHLEAKEEAEREKFEWILQAGTPPPRAPGYPSTRVG